jgi:hypothetical protein
MMYSALARKLDRPGVPSVRFDPRSGERENSGRLVCANPCAKAIDIRELNSLDELVATSDE